MQPLMLQTLMLITQPFLAGAELKSVYAEEVFELMGKGYVFVSVIPSEDFNKYHPKGQRDAPFHSPQLTKLRRCC